MNLKDLDILSLQTYAMQNDKTTQAMSYAINNQVGKILEQIYLINIYNNIDNLNEELLDKLAYDFDITWYDATSTIDVKKRLIKTGIKINNLLGTPYAVEEVIKMYFGDGEVKEWVEYGGEPYNFKVVTSNPSVTQELAGKFIKILNCVKNERSHLETILISLTGQMEYRTGIVIQITEKSEIRQVG